MNRENTTQTELVIGSSRMTVTNDWVNAQTRSNMQAGLGVSCMVGVVVVGATIVLGWDNETLVVAVLLSILIGVFYFGWLSFSRFSADEWLDSAARKAMVERLVYLESLEEHWSSVEATNEELRKDNKELVDRNRKLEAKLREIRPTVRAVEMVTPAIRRELPKNVEAAEVIHREWKLDPMGGSSINRTKLMQLGNLTRVEVELGWDFLKRLGFADKAGDANNSKWVVTNEDADDLRRAIDEYLATAPVGNVPAY